MYSIPNCFRDTALSLYSSLDLASIIVLPSRRTVPLSEACESVWSVSWPLWLLIVTLLEYCEKCRICCKFTASAKVVTAAVEEYCQRFPIRRILDSREFSKFLRHCVNVIPFLVLMFHLNEHANNMWRKRKNILQMVQHSPTTSMRRLYTSRCFTNTCMANIAWWRPVPLSHAACAKFAPGGQCHASRILSFVTLIVNYLH
jgi:hypothetical protein